MSRICLPPSERLSTARYPWPEGWFMDVELVRIDLALYDVLAEAPGPGDEDHVAEAGFGVEGEGDPA
jgi:hypothetical protein